MSHYITLRCACGEAAVDGSSWFTAVVWDDVLGCLGPLGIGNPYSAIPAEGRQAGGGEFLAWWEDALARMRAARERLPTIYRVWNGDQTEAAYCVCRGRGWMVEGTYDELTATALPADVWLQRRASLGYEPPTVEDTAPELASAFSPGRDGGRTAIALSADGFERIFRAAPPTLEHGPLPDFFAAELGAVEALARHAAARGEPVRLYGY